jgi:hypothetical protein
MLRSHRALTWSGESARSSNQGEIGHLPPVEFEIEHYRQINAQQQPLLGEPSLH